MNKDVARKIALAEVISIRSSQNMTTDDVWAIVEGYLSALKVCHVCEGSGTIVTRNHIKTNDRYNNGGIAQGTTIPCPNCPNESGYDPNFVAWRCVEDWRQCAPGRPPDSEDEHEASGWRLFVDFGKSGSPELL